MLVGKLIIIPALGHQNKETWTSEAWLAFVLMSQCGNNNELARHHVPCDRLLQKAYFNQRNSPFARHVNAARRKSLEIQA